eukprot:g6340.t2
MTPHGGTRTQQEGDQEDEGVILLRRLDALERLVFGRSHSAAGAEAAPVREVEPLARKIEAVSKTVSRAEGGGRDLQDLALKARSAQGEHRIYGKGGSRDHGALTVASQDFAGAHQPSIPSRYAAVDSPLEPIRRRAHQASHGVSPSQRSGGERSAAL